MTEAAILDLKRQALQAKKSGDLGEARRLLEEAKQMAAASAQTSADFKRLALERKRQGDIEGARDALAQARRVEAQEQQQRQDHDVTNHPSSSETLLRSIENGVRSGASSCNEQQPKEAKTSPTDDASAPPSPTTRDDSRAILQAEMSLAKDQVRMYRYYAAFVDETTGKEQLEFWNRYEQALASAIIQGKADLPDVTTRTSDHGASKLVSDNLLFVGESCDASDQGIEVSLLDVVGLLENKHMKRLLENPKTKKSMQLNPGTIRAVVTVQLPPNPDQPDDYVEQSFEVESSSTGVCSFEESTVCVDGARGSTRFAKLLARRLQRRRVTVDVYHVPEKKKLLSRSSNKTLLGSAVLELKDLLTSNYIAGEFPLLDVTRRHECGGHVRVAIRTGAPFSAEGDQPKPKKEASTTGVAQSSEPILQPFPALSSLLDQSPPASP